MSIVSGIVGPLIGAGAARSAAQTQADAALQAGDAQIAAAEIAADVQREMQERNITFQQGLFDVQQENLRPFLEAGTTALGQLATRAAPGGEFATQLAQPFEPFDEPFSFGLEEFQESPGFRFRVEEGERILNRGAAARGSLVSGSQLRDLVRFGQGEASQEFATAHARALAERNQEFGEELTAFELARSGTLNQANLLASLAGVGQTAQQSGAGVSANFGGTVANILNTSGTNISNLAVRAGDATASGINAVANAQAAGAIGSANAINQGLSNIGRIPLQLLQLQQAGLLNFGTSGVGPTTGFGGGAGFAGPIAASGGAA